MFRICQIKHQNPYSVVRPLKQLPICGSPTAQQDVRSQRPAISEYVRKHDFRIDDFIKATASRQASEKHWRTRSRRSGNG